MSTERQRPYLDRATLEAQRPQPGRYRHYKGQLYEVLGSSLHSETLQVMVVYRALYGDGNLWVRPRSMFLSDVEVDGATVPRFAPLTAGEPSSEQRRALLDAGLDLIAERGFPSAAAADIEARAGADAGTFVAAFPDEGTWITAAFEHMFERRIDEYRAAVEAVPAADRSIETAVDTLVGFFANSTWAAFLELFMAARAHPDLHDELRATTTAADRRIGALLPELLGASSATLPEPALGLMMLWFDGLALGLFVTDGLFDEAAIQAMAELLKGALRGEG
jgi:hypothetical protein